MGGRERWLCAMSVSRHAQAALSPGVVVLLVIAALVAALGFGRLPDPLLDLGVLLVGVFIVLVARICQARDQHLALCRLLGQEHRSRRY